MGHNHDDDDDYHDHDDPEELRKVLSVVSTEIPKLIESITKTMYNKENAENMAKAVAEFYKSMKQAGMTDAQAYTLTKEFMSSFSVGGLISKAIHGTDVLEEKDEIDELVEERIREKIRENRDRMRERKENSHEHDEED